jgi:hypothetical protein
MTPSTAAESRDTGPVPAAPPRRIYLDQNAWIQLSRQHFGKTHDSQLAQALELIQQRAQTGSASFPLSGSHYFETIKHGYPAARQRLGHLMFSIAGSDRIADCTQLLLPELHSALSVEHNLRTPPPAQPFGRGFAYLFPEAGDPYSSPGINAAVERAGRPAVEALLEVQMLTGPPFQLPAEGIARPDDTFSQR